MAIDVACLCGKAFRVKDEVAGRRVKCPACGRVLDIPTSSTPPLEAYSDPLGGLQNASSLGYDPMGDYSAPLPPRRRNYDGLIRGLMILAGVTIGLMMLSMVILTLISAFRPSGDAEQPVAVAPTPLAPKPPAPSSTTSESGKSTVSSNSTSGTPSSSGTSTTVADASSSTKSDSPSGDKEKAGSPAASKGEPLVALSHATIERLGKTEPLKGVQVGPDKLPMQGYSWMVQLLPFVEQNDLYTRFDFSKPWDEEPNTQLTGTVVPAFLNAADSRQKWEGYPFDKMALTHFVGISGVEDQRNVVAAALSRSDPRAGIFGYDEIAKPADVTDGTSQTLMIIGSGELAAPWVQGGGATIRGAREPYFHEITGFGSKGLSKRGAQAVLADGSVRFISADIDPRVFKSMCTIRGADSVDLSANPHVTASP